MLDILRTRLRQGSRTLSYPRGEPDLPVGFRGRPHIDSTKCVEGCAACVAACPTEAISVVGSSARIDLGRCVFCLECVRACPGGAIEFTPDHRMAVRSPDDLTVDGPAYRLAEALDRKSRALFGRSLRLRQVSAGGCNGCEVEVAALGNIVFDVARFGVQFVASPRHADGLLITGPVPRNMAAALRATYEAVPEPKMVIAVGACAISGGLFRGLPEVPGDWSKEVPVDLYVPGCPPHPVTIIDGILRLLGRLPKG